MDVSGLPVGRLKPDSMDQRALICSIVLLLLLLASLLIFLRSSYQTGAKVPECDAPVVLDQLHKSGLVVSLSAASNSIESVALDRSLGHRVCLIKSHSGVSGGEGVKFVVSTTDHLPSLLRVEVTSDQAWLKQAAVSGHTVDEL